MDGYWGAPAGVGRRVRWRLYDHTIIGELGLELGVVSRYELCLGHHRRAGFADCGDHA